MVWAYESIITVLTKDKNSFDNVLMTGEERLFKRIQVIHSLLYMFCYQMAYFSNTIGALKMFNIALL